MVPFSEGVQGNLRGVRSFPSRPLCHPRQCQASSICVSGCRPESVEARHVPTPLGPSIGLCLPSICSAQAGVVDSFAFNRTLIGSGVAVVAPQGVVCRPFVSVSRRTARASAGVKLDGATPPAEVSSRLRDPPDPLVEVVQRLVRKAAFSREVL